MATRLVTPLYQAVDANGDPGDGWKLTFYETGTTTLKDTYSNEALTVANANPVICNSDGRPANTAGDPVDIFGVSKEDYKVILLDADDNVIETKDPVDSVTYDINSFDPRPKQHWGTTTGTAAAFLIQPDPSITAYSADIIFSIQTHLDNNAGSTLAVFEEGTVSTYLAALDMMKYDNAGAKVALEAGDNQAGQTYDYRIDGTDAVCLNPGIPYLNLLNTTKATIAIEGIASLNKYWIWGFVPISGTDPDEEVTITAGKALAEDGITFVELAATATDLNYVTLNGGALANDTTYHLFRYLRDDDTMQWHLEDSLTPTIADIESAGAYRRIISVLTDGAADILKFIGTAIDDSIIITYNPRNRVQWSSVGIVADTLVVIEVPLGLNFICSFTASSDTNAPNDLSVYSYNETTPAVQMLIAGSAGIAHYQTMSLEAIVCDTSGQVRVDTTVAASTSLYLNNYTDTRNYY